MADIHQTLFSFELFVEYVRIDDTRKMNTVEPAVAIRLLDFPTLLIYRSENHDPLSKPVSKKVYLRSETFSEENGYAYSFKKGKSCLFKINLNLLHTHLSNTPLYAMLLDVRRNIPKLIGSSLISLEKLTDRIKLDVEKRGIYAPASYGEKVISPLFNLLGESVGAISLAYKIVSLGTSLIPQISEGRLDELGASLKLSITSIKNNAAYAIQSSLPENITGNAHLQPDCYDEQPRGTCVVAVTTQTQDIQNKDVAVITEVKRDDDDKELLCSTFCPPPLFYSASEKNKQQHAAEMEGVNKIYVPKGGMWDRLVSDGSKRDRLHSDGGNVGIQYNDPVPSLLGDSILQLPVLNALIGELSDLSDQIHNDQHPFLVPPNLARLCISAEQPSPTSASEKKAKTEVLNTADSPIQAVFQLCPSQSNASFKGQQESPHYKGKLRCGLTRTFHLRLKQVKLASTNQLECRDQFKIKQLEPWKKAYVKPKKNFSASLISKRGKNEHVEKLSSNLEIDPAHFEVVSNLKKNITAHPMSSNLLKAEGVYYKSDKEVQTNAQIPSKFSQNSDHNDEPSVSNHYMSSFYLNQTECDMLSARESDGEPCSTSYRAASSQDTVESEKYQDDFTNLDTTEGSPDPLSSPELSRSQMGQSSCGSSSNSFHGNMSHPVHFKMSHSPKESLKDIHVIKPHLKSSDNMLRTDDDDENFLASISTNSKYWQRDPESQNFPKSLNLPRNFRRSESVQNDNAEESAPIGEQSMDKVLPSNKFVLESPDPDEKDDLASLGFQNAYRPISDLVINKLPGYTL